MRRDILTVVSEFGKKYRLFDTENIIVGLSGGPDSVALITILASLASEDPGFPKLYAVHVNHNLRPEAGADQALAQRCAERLGIPFEAVSVDVRGLVDTTGRSEEECGRILRYKAFDEYALEHFGSGYREVSRIAVAHHRGDLAETMMMNLFRGAGLEGLVSPEPINGRVIRPLLCVSKEDLTALLIENDIEYATDLTNLENNCTRNVWRNEILPAIGKVSVKPAQKALIDTYELLSSDLSYLKETADAAYDDIVIRHGGFVFAQADRLGALHDAISGRVIRRMWQETFGDLVDFEKIHLDKAASLAASGSGMEKSLDLGRGRQVVTAAGYLVFCDGNDRVAAMCAVAELMGFATSQEPVDIEIDRGTAVTMPEKRLNISIKVVENKVVMEYNNCSWVFEGAPGTNGTVRLMNGLPDLKFCRSGNNIVRSLRDVLSERKVPREAREHIIVAATEDKILWIPGAGHA